MAVGWPQGRAVAQSPEAEAPAGLAAADHGVVPSAAPRLVVVIAVDQLSQTLSRRFEAGLYSGTGIYARVNASGYACGNAHHEHAFTFTGPGHACLLTGASPRDNGIIGNAWYDRNRGRTVNCVLDEQTRTIGGDPSAAPASAQNLLAATLGDMLKLNSGGRGKVFGIGYKDRAAILTAGRMADGAFWFDGKSGHWVTSTFYREDVPGYLRVLNEGGAARAFAGRSWELLKPDTHYHLARPDDSPFEKPVYGLTRSFPHVLPEAGNRYYYNQLIASPWGNEYTLSSAVEIIRGEQLGRDEHPDLLTINLAGNDYVGHHFGPYSLEVEDMFYRTDAALGQFVDTLDELVGAGNWTLAVSADHGVAPIPEYLAAQGLPAGRDPLGKLSDVKQQLNRLLAERLQRPVIAVGRRPQLLAKPPELAGKEGGEGEGESAQKLVLEVESNQVYLNTEHPLLQGAGFIRAQQLVRQWLLDQPSVSCAFTREQLLQTGDGGDAVQAAFHRAFHRERSGDVLFGLAPYHVYSGSYSATHGSHWSYDTHVPLMLLGRGIRSGQHDQLVHPTQLAATLARLLRVEVPGTARRRMLPGALVE